MHEAASRNTQNTHSLRTTHNLQQCSLDPSSARLWLPPPPSPAQQPSQPSPVSSSPPVPSQPKPNPLSMQP
ncbi:hypothetical protein G7K_2758-t1 [Saitoella complicata NRRL Y-17804]|uniref:Uncharacterized protein n=1 Tax=Saitoella complicata (strain BCRC 22490 / CBS 7301 / JCM 7358 / NBRC 10748 / NRRL Y-17804) TaxID=698492 RepID=A0A0E9NGP8_SAICN|nr:hypothetical protein G7K_2758-t1 [Saitoella complicata NRRL Y-17804]